MDPSTVYNSNCQHCQVNRRQIPRNSPVRKTKSDVETLWYCEQCNFGPHNIYLYDHCIRCQHGRCEDCSIEVDGNRVPTRESISFRQEICVSQLDSSLPIESHLSEFPITTYQAQSSQHEKPLQWAENSTLSERSGPVINLPANIHTYTQRSNQELPATDTIAGPKAPQSGTNVKSLPMSSSSSSTHKSLVSMDSISCNTDTESETDHSSPAEAESITFEYESYVERVATNLDDHIMRILYDHLDLAAHLIPQVHRHMNHAPKLPENSSARTWSGSAQILPGINVAADYAESPGASGNGSLDIATRSSSNTNRKHSGLSKRRRKSNVSDSEGNDEAKKRPNRGPSDPTDMSSSQAPKRKPRFACHFHKNDPEKYGTTNLRYRTCAGPGSVELRRLKAHMKKYHKPFQCVRCYTIFSNIDELSAHQRSEMCFEGSPALKEGLDECQWAKIEPMLKVKRGISLAERGEHDIVKWFEIWKIIFPELPQPSHPWIDSHQFSKAGSPLDIETIISAFEDAIETDLQQGNIQPDDDTHQRYLNALRLVLASNASITASTSNTMGSIRFSNSLRTHQIESRQSSRESENPDSMRSPENMEVMSYDISSDQENLSAIENTQAEDLVQSNVSLLEDIDWNAATSSDRYDFATFPNDTGSLTVDNEFVPDVPTYHLNATDQSVFSSTTQSQVDPRAFVGIDLDSLHSHEILIPRDPRQEQQDQSQPNDFESDELFSDVIESSIYQDSFTETLANENELPGARQPLKSKTERRKIMRKEHRSIYGLEM